MGPGEADIERRTQQVVLPEFERRLLLILNEDIVAARRRLDDLIDLRSQVLDSMNRGGLQQVDEITGYGAVTHANPNT